MALNTWSANVRMDIVGSVKKLHVHGCLREDVLLAVVVAARTITVLVAAGLEVLRVPLRVRVVLVHVCMSRLCRMKVVVAVSLERVQLRVATTSSAVVWVRRLETVVPCRLHGGGLEVHEEGMVVNLRRLRRWWRCCGR